MSHPNNDAYLEELETAEQDLKDAKEALINANNTLDEDYRWKMKMQAKYDESEKRLSALKSQG